MGIIRGLGCILYEIMLKSLGRFYERALSEASLDMLMSCLNVRGK